MDIRRRNLMGQVPITANVTIKNVKGSWGESSKTVSGYQVYESKGSYNVNNGYDLAKVTFSGYPEFTFLYGSYAESSYDYMKISPLDYSAARNWTSYSSSGELLSSSDKQSSSAPNLSYTFTNDGGVEELNNGFRFNGTSTSYLTGNFATLTSANYENCTIELVLKSGLKSGVWSPIVIFGDWDDPSTSQYIGASVNYDSNVNYNHSLLFVARARNASTYCYKIPANILMTTSLKSNQPIIANLLYYNETSTTSMKTVSNKTQARIGGRVDGSSIVTFKGDIHAIRVYNRLLTEDEILYNQTIDIKKYNIPI